MFGIKDLDVPNMLPLVFVTIGFGILFMAVYNVALHPIRKIPGPFWAKILPQYMSPALLAGRRAQRLLELHEKYGPLVRVAPNEVSISDYNLYREIYSAKKSTKLAAFYKAATFLGHENIFSMRDVRQHAGRRKMQTQPYSQQAINENEPLILETAERLVERLHQGSNTSTAATCTTDAYRLCGLFSLEIIGRTAFNKNISEPSLDDGFRLLTAMDDSGKIFPIDATLPFLKKFGVGQYVPGFIGHTFKQHKLWETLTRELFRKFQLSSKGDSTERFMATPLLEKEDSYLGRKLTEDEAVEEAMGLMFAGSGTTSTTLTYLLYELSLPENVGIQQTLHQELQKTHSKLQDLRSLPYLNAVIKETLRLHPTIISTLPRLLSAPVSCRKTDIVLPAGTAVGMQNYVHHRDPSIYHDPHTFNPDRWVDQNASPELEKALTPFSLGPRNCIGQNLAWAELYLATATVFKKLELQLNSGMTRADMDMEDRFNIAPRGRKLLLDVRRL